MTLSHYRNAVGAILVYDVSNEESYHNLEYWLKELRQKLDPYALIALCANKCDIMLTTPEKREVMKEMGKKFAKQHDLFYLDECSALADINVKETIMGLVQGIYNIQTALIDQGLRSENQLKVTDEHMSLHYQHRCCY